MAELADAQDLGSCEAIRVGSTPTTRTKKKDMTKRCLPIRKHRGAREKRYSFGYAVFLILALMK